MIKFWIQHILILLPVFTFSQTLSQNLAYEEIAITPGKSTSISFILENLSDKNNTYTIDISSSSSFIIPILKNEKIDISANESAVYIAPIKISAEATKGKYLVNLVGLDDNNTIVLKKTAEITVSEKKDISLIPIDYPEFTKAGETITASFLLKNNGNIIENLLLESKNAVINNTQNIVLQPGESQTIILNKKTNASIEQNELQNIDLSIISQDTSQEKQTAYASVKIITTKPTENDVYHRLPISASLLFLGMRNMGAYNNGFQGKISGKGSLDNDNRNNIEFSAITKNPIEFSSFSQYEEYYINYKRNNLFVHLGDKNYSSSYLTEFARYGRGAELKYDLKTISFGGFYNRPRFFKDTKEEYNLYSSFKINKSSEIKAGYLYKILEKQDDKTIYNLASNVSLPYLTGKIQISDNIITSGEFAYSKTKDLDGSAFMLQTQINLKKINGNLMYMQASPEFAGYFTNSKTFNGNLQYRISKRINFFINYSQDAKNYRRDTLFYAAPYRKYLQSGLQYNYSTDGYILLTAGNQTYKDRLVHKQFDYTEKFIRASINQQLGIFILNLETQLGKTDNNLTGFKGNSSFYTANLTFEKFKTSFNLYASYSVVSRYQQQNQSITYYGARIFNRLSDKTSFSIFYQNNYMPEEYYKDRNLFEAMLHQEITKNNLLDVSGRYSLQQGQIGHKDFIFSLRYTMKMNVPIKKIAEYTTLSGNVSNLGVQKVEGLKLILGNYVTITDKEGNYLFKNIIPGDYFLEIDRSTLPINEITTIPFPISLNLSQKNNIFNFGITNSTLIKGYIKLSEDGENLQSKELQKTDNSKKESIILEATNGQQVYRKIVYIDDYFDFTYLRPGDWKITIYRNGLNKRYKIPIDTYEFTLKPSEIKEISVAIIKQQSKISARKPKSYL